MKILLINLSPYGVTKILVAILCWIGDLVVRHLQEVKNKEKFQIFSSKVVADAYERWSLTRSWFNLADFGILENWPLRRGGRSWRFHCILICVLFSLLLHTKIFKRLLFVFFVRSPNGSLPKIFNLSQETSDQLCDHIRGTNPFFLFSVTFSCCKVFPSLNKFIIIIIIVVIIIIIITFYIITKSMHALWLVNQLWVLVTINPQKNRASSELLYKSNQVIWWRNEEAWAQKF